MLSGICCYLQERIPIEEVFEQLKCTREGLTSEEGAHRLQLCVHVLTSITECIGMIDRFMLMRVKFQLSPNHRDRI